jgi:hypothetical protein
LISVYGYIFKIVIENIFYSFWFFINILIFKIGKINLEYVEIFPTEIPQCLQRRHWGFSAFSWPWALIKGVK